MNTKRTRNDPRREATREALIEAAETMIGEAGVEGVSLRQIGAAVGSLNKTVVTYHFGSKDALIEAIYRHRLPLLDERRGVLRARIEQAGLLDNVEALLWVMWQPLFEQVNEAGMHSYARFLGSVFRAGLARSRGRISSDFAATAELSERVRNLLPSDAECIREMRWAVARNMVLDCLLLIDQRPTSSPGEAQHLFDDTITMATAALLAPAHPASRSVLSKGRSRRLSGQLRSRDSDRTT
jgi:AcrR family transcriptional regulator